MTTHYNKHRTRTPKFQVEFSIGYCVPCCATDVCLLVYSIYIFLDVTSEAFENCTYLATYLMAGSKNVGPCNVAVVRVS